MPFIACLASAKRGNPGESDGFFLERLAQSGGELFGIEMAGPAPDGVRSSIGDRFSNVSPLDEAAVASLIQWRTVSGYIERVSRSTAESAENAERSFFSACSAFSAVNVGCFAACSKACSKERAALAAL